MQKKMKLLSNFRFTLVRLTGHKKTQNTLNQNLF
jgi:hypothetical protein